MLLLLFIAILLCISLAIKNFDNSKMHGTNMKNENVGLLFTAENTKTGPCSQSAVFSAGS